MFDDEEQSESQDTTRSQHEARARTHSSPTPGRNQALHQSTPPQLTSADGQARPYIRVSPYPQRVRTPPTHAGHPTRASPAPPAAPSTASSTAQQHQLQLVVRPIVKSTVGQRDTSGETLDVFAVNGDTFEALMHKLWLKFSPRVKCQAVKQDGVWTVDTPAEASWNKVMQFKGSRHLVDSSKTDQAWSRWVVSTRGETIRLMIYEYGMAITKAHDLEEFLDACIRPTVTDRSGAAAESSLRDVVAQLQDVWAATFQASAVVWCMWANHITRGLNRSTWERAILDPPPAYIAALLKPADLPAELQLAQLSHSSFLALEVVNSAIEDNKKQNDIWKAHGELLENQRLHLESRKRAIEAILADDRPTPLSDVIDPLPRLTNVDDVEHQE